MEHLVQSLKREHQIILRLLSQFEKTVAQSPSTPEKLRIVLELVEQYIGELHHHKEETLLFPEFFRLSDSDQGGARCTYFFGRKIELNLNAKILSLVTELNGKYHLEMHDELQEKGTEQPQVISEILRSKHPLSIPIEDHRSGYLARTCLKRLLNRNYNELDLKRLSSAYIALMREHIDREDTCLFPLIEEVIGPQRLSEVSARITWEAFDDIERRVAHFLEKVDDLRGY